MTAAPIAGDVLAHLDAQLGSARRLLAQILRQSGAIRRRDVDGVLATMTDIQGEMASRGRLESERTALLWRAGGMLGVPAEAVTLSEQDALEGQRGAILLLGARARGTDLGRKRDAGGEVDGRDHCLIPLAIDSIWSCVRTAWLAI